jgi:hypothetical protein
MLFPQLISKIFIYLLLQANMLDWFQVRERERERSEINTPTSYFKYNFKLS